MTALRVLTIGGLDPGGGAGLTADARTLHAFGALSLPVATALTVQNRHGLQRCAVVEADVVRDSLRAALADGPLDAIKTGLFAAASTVHLIADELAGVLRAGVPLVVDPVLSATAGGWDGGDALAAALTALAARATVVTPNLPELDRLVAGDVAQLAASGCAVLVKGGHGDGDAIVDRLVVKAGLQTEFHHPRIERGPVHGTGCVLASGLACLLARGESIERAARTAIAHVQACLRATPTPPGPDPEPLVIVAP